MMKSGNNGLGARKAISGCELLFFSLLLFQFSYGQVVLFSHLHLLDLFDVTGIFLFSSHSHVSLIPLPSPCPLLFYVLFSSLTTTILYATSHQVFCFWLTLLVSSLALPCLSCAHGSLYPLLFCSMCLSYPKQA
jgi:hypothetical protein